MPNCQTTGNAQMALTAQITNIVLMALGSCDMVWDLSGWHMAT